MSNNDYKIYSVTDKIKVYVIQTCVFNSKEANKKVMTETTTPLMVGANIWFHRHWH